MEDRYGKYTLLTGLEAPRKCFWCGADVDGRHRYCCEEHRDLYYKHFCWPDAAQWCLERYHYKCADCPDPARVAHHLIPLNGEPRFWNVKNRPENLAALCYGCHGKRHAGVKPNVWVRAQDKGQLVFEELVAYV